MSPRPERAFSSAVVALWPQFGDDCPDQHELDKTYGYAVAGRKRKRHLPGRNHPLQKAWDDLGPTTTRPLLRILCSGHHWRAEAPMLAEVWNSPRGPFFLSRLPGAFRDPPDNPRDPFAPPSAVLPRRWKQERHRVSGGGPRYGGRWRPVPVTVVRLFLDDPLTDEAQLWAKCADHGPGLVDRNKLLQAYAEDRTRRQRRDTRRATVIGLDSVGTLFCC